MATRTPPPELVALVEKMHSRIRDEVRRQLPQQSADALLRISAAGAGDVSLAIDLPAERIVRETFEVSTIPICVVAEGIGTAVFPSDRAREEAEFIVIVDPLDGSRELGALKRSAWILTGIAPLVATATPTLSDIVFALQTEVPPPQQDQGIVMRASQSGPALQEVWRLPPAGSSQSDAAAMPIGETAIGLTPSSARTVRGGYAVFADYFHGAHAATGVLADRVLTRVLGAPNPGEATTYNDQYISTGGCLYLLASGRYRFIADLRPLLDEALRVRGSAIGLCAHPYDLCTALIAERAGCLITDPAGAPLAYPLDTDTDCAWIGYANREIQTEVAGALHAELADLVTELRTGSAPNWRPASN